MYLSRKLISQFFPRFNYLKDQEIFEIFNALGIELESVFNFEKTKNLVVGEVLSFEKIEGSNNLNLCKVKISSKNKVNTIICGANNFLAGDKVIVALEGCKLFNGREINYKKIKGIESQGMICSYEELTSRSQWMNQKEMDDIIVLPSIAEVGDRNPLRFINFDDEIFELSIPSNRNELNSVFGIIYELQSFLNLKKNLDHNDLKDFLSQAVKVKNDISKNHFLLKIENENYLHSNWITKSYLMNSGIVPSNSIEDIAKLTQVLCGIPMMVFTNLKSHKIEIKKVERDSKIELANYGSVVLKKGDVVFRNENQIIGLMNLDVAKKYAIDEKAKSIYFLAAHVDPLDIRKTSGRLKIMNEAVKATNKPIAPWWYRKTLDMLVRNLKPKFSNIMLDFKYSASKPLIINLDFKKANQLLGTNLSNDEITKILKAFDYTIDHQKITCPLYRSDIVNDHDILEDILKVKKIQDVQATQVNSSTINLNHNKGNDLKSKISNLLIHEGFYLIKSYNLVAKDTIKNFNYFGYKNPIKILNPISSEKEWMKLSLFDNILNCYSYNESFKNDLVPIFEIQDLYFDKNTKRKHLVLAVANNLEINKLNKSIIYEDIFYLKRAVNAIADLFNIKFDYEKGIKHEWGCIQDSLKINFNKKNIGYITRINPLTLKSSKIKNDKIYLAEIDLTDLLAMKKIPSFITPIENKHKIVRELTISLPVDFDLNKFYKITNSLSIIEELEINDAYYENEYISYTIKFNLISDEKDIKDNFAKVIDYFKSHNLKIKE
ncbi:MAG: phenylalanine--tRNA ligase subunit beta [Mycoplasmoidaceae bacterium]